MKKILCTLLLFVTNNVFSNLVPINSSPDCGIGKAPCTKKATSGSGYMTAMPFRLDIFDGGGPPVYFKDEIRSVASGVRYRTTGSGGSFSQNATSPPSAAYRDTNVEQSAGGGTYLSSGWITIDKTNPGYLAQGLTYYKNQLGNYINIPANASFCVTLFVNGDISNRRSVMWGMPALLACSSDTDHGDRYTPEPPIEACNPSGDINVSFGDVDRATLTTAGNTSKTAKYKVACTGISNLPTHSYKGRFDATPVSWSASQMSTSTTGLGVNISLDGINIPIGKEFDLGSARGTLEKTFKFTLARNPAVSATNIATGNFHASATLIVTQD